MWERKVSVMHGKELCIRRKDGKREGDTEDKQNDDKKAKDA